MPICENGLFKNKKFNTLECTGSKYSSQINTFKKTNKTLSKECRPSKDNDFYSLITFYDSIPGWYYFSYNPTVTFKIVKFVMI